MSVDDRARRAEARPQPRMANARRALMTMNHHEGTARQVDRDPFGELAQQPMIMLGPLTGAVVVAEHGEDPAKPGLQLRQDRGIADIAAVDGQIAGCHQFLDALVQTAVGIGEEGDPLSPAKSPRSRPH